MKIKEHKNQPIKKGNLKAELPAKKSALIAVKPKKKGIDKVKKASKKVENDDSTYQGVAGKIPQIKQGKYADGLPFDEVQYLCFKLILKPNRFKSRTSLFDFSKVLRKPAESNGIIFTPILSTLAPIKIREVVFIDTPDFRLYNNSFILRRRVCYEDGFPTHDPEIVFKFRNADIQKAAEIDIRPQITGDHRIKFKCQILPLKEELGGSRILYSHNVQFPRSSVNINEVLDFDFLVKVFPPLAHLRKAPKENIQMVNETIVEEVLQDIGVLDFGNGLTAKANVAIWRTRGEHMPLIAEFAFQITFKDRKELKIESMKRAEAFFIALQYAAKDWISLKATKTGVVYRLMGNEPKSHE